MGAVPRYLFFPLSSGSEDGAAYPLIPFPHIKKIFRNYMITILLEPSELEQAV